MSKRSIEVTAFSWKLFGLSTSQTMLAVGLVLVGMGQTLLYTLLAPIARQVGLSEIQVGYVVALSALILTVASPLWGRIIDRSGSRIVFLLGMFSYAVGSCCFALVLDAGVRLILSATSVFYLLIFIRLLYAIMTAGIHPAAMANIAITTSENLRPAKMGTMSACFGLGSTLGPLLGAALGGYGVLVPLYVVSGLALLNVVLGFFAIENPKKITSLKDRRTQSPRLSFLDPRVTVGLLATVMVYVGFSALQQSIAFHIQDTLGLNSSDTVRQTGVVIFGLAVAMVFTQLVVVQHFLPGPKKAVLIGSALAFSGLAAIALGASTIPQLTLCAFLAGAGFSFLFPGLQGQLSNAVSEAEQGSIAGLSFGAAALGYVIGPVTGTTLLAVGHGATYWCAAILVIMGALMTLMAPHWLR
ncbi:MFS transporter [Pseudomonas syringae]|uniref:MFS transporter n=1 Tax=Pseudomonas syringae TaxID=317 RepID=UPI003F7512A6